jgi:hypothetical protein
MPAGRFCSVICNPTQAKALGWATCRFRFSGFIIHDRRISSLLLAGRGLGVEQFLAVRHGEEGVVEIESDWAANRRKMMAGRLSAVILEPAQAGED